jgi:hypothetical protein
MPRMNSRLFVSGLSLAFFAVACIDPKCPKGYNQKGDTCYRMRDAGPEAGADDNDPEVYDGGSDLEGSEHDADPESTALIDAGSCMGMGARADCEVEVTGGDACDPNPCEHGGICAATALGASCDCIGTGYEGTTCTSDVDECASDSSCTSIDYPCVQTEAPGYTCRGQLADWSMPDAVVGAKVKPSYDVATNPEIVIDRVTGLVWQRNLPTTYPGCTAMDSLAMGSARRGDVCTWQEAKDYCGALALGGFTDWRLPAKIELESIVDDTRSVSPAYDPAVFPNVPLTLKGYAWSSSQVPNEARNVYIIVPHGKTWTAFTEHDGAEGAMGVRCVRSPRVPSGTPTTRYQVSNLGTATVTDTRTGLVWQRNVDSKLYSLGGANAYCVALGTGWRVPTKKELLTSVDPELVGLDATVFPGTPAGAFWSVSPIVNNPGRYWSVLKVTSESPEDDQNYVRCVR